MFNRTYQLGARRTRLRGEQLDIYFPRRGRTSRFRRLERAGQMRLDLLRPSAESQPVTGEPICAKAKTEYFDQALDYLFPIRPMTEDELATEFDRLFPPSS